MVLVWYPKCSTCQRAKAWLDEHGVTYTLRDIKEENPNAEELRAWHEKSGLPLRRFFNTSGLLYKGMALKDKLPGMTDNEQYILLGEYRNACEAAFDCGGRFCAGGFPRGGMVCSARLIGDMPAGVQFGFERKQALVKMFRTKWS